jgi:hypothetical protein
MREGKSSLRYGTKSLPLDHINLLPQPRKTFEHITELSEDIALKGILNLPIVARFTEVECIQYLAIVNDLWKREFTLNDLVSVTEKDTIIYYVLVAGERRFRSCRRLWNEGCEMCVTMYGNELPGSCFRRHFEEGLLEVRLCLGATALQMLYIQLSENTHMSVPSHEEAFAYHQLFSLLRSEDPAFTLAEFARRVGRDSSTVQRALRYCELPRSVQELVEMGALHYSAAVELSRFYLEGVKEEELLWWAQRGALYPTVEEFRRVIGDHFSEIRQGQISILELFDRKQQEEMKRRHVRLIFEEPSLRALWACIYYFRKLHIFFERKLIGCDDAVYSLQSPINVFRQLITIQKKILPLLREAKAGRPLPKAVSEEAQQVLDGMEEFLTSLVPQEKTIEGVQA